MHTKFMMGDTTVDVVKFNEETALNDLPPMVYTIKYDDLRGYYLSITKDKLEIPSKIYGKASDRADKVLKSYKDRSTSTGILMTGDKGTGKTLLMSLLANNVIESLGLPVILVKDAYAGTQFISFIELIGECCLVFDEFGKLYPANTRDGASQDSLLSLMDGVDKTKRMFILTENSELDINEFMINRPSRVYYHFKYRKLDEDSIRGYCEDMKLGENIVQDIIDLSRKSKIFSFDMLQSIVEEHIRFDYSIEESVKDLNIQIKEGDEELLEVVKVLDKNTREELKVHPSSMMIQKPGRYVYITLVSEVEVEEDESDFIEAVDVDEDSRQFYINESDLAYEDKGQGIYETDKYIVVTRDIIRPNMDYKSLLV